MLNGEEPSSACGYLPAAPWTLGSVYVNARVGRVSRWRSQRPVPCALVCLPKEAAALRWPPSSQSPHNGKAS